MRVRRRWPALFALMALAVTSCADAGGRDAAGASPTSSRGWERPQSSPGPARSGNAAPTLVAAGDIADEEHEAALTAKLIELLDPSYVVTLGDNAYPSGSARDYEKYDRTWGAHLEKTRPVPGNHEYETDGAAGYFHYFADQVGGRAYYAWNAGSWRLYALNCEVACGAGSAQRRWLRKDLAQAGKGRHILAYVHRPRYTCSTRHRPYRALSAIWEDLSRRGGRIMLAGHNHAYERFTPLASDGRARRDGVRQFVVGTGGAPLYEADRSCRHREAAEDGSRGVLWLRLGTDFYEWKFVAVTGRVFDAGRERVGSP